MKLLHSKTLTDGVILLVSACPNMNLMAVVTARQLTVYRSTTLTPILVHPLHLDPTLFSTAAAAAAGSSSSVYRCAANSAVANTATGLVSACWSPTGRIFVLSLPTGKILFFDVETAELLRCLAPRPRFQSSSGHRSATRKDDEKKSQHHDTHEDDDDEEEEELEGDMETTATDGGFAPIPKRFIRKLYALEANPVELSTTPECPVAAMLWVRVPTTYPPNAFYHGAGNGVMLPVHPGLMASLFLDELFQVHTTNTSSSGSTGVAAAAAYPGNAFYGTGASMMAPSSAYPGTALPVHGAAYGISTTATATVLPPAFRMDCLSSGGSEGTTGVEHHGGVQTQDHAGWSVAERSHTTSVSLLFILDAKGTLSVVLGGLHEVYTSQWTLPSDVGSPSPSSSASWLEQLRIRHMCVVPMKQKTASCFSTGSSSAEQRSSSLTVHENAHHGNEEEDYSNLVSAPATATATAAAPSASADCAGALETSPVAAMLASLQHTNVLWDSNALLTALSALKQEKEKNPGSGGEAQTSPVAMRMKPLTRATATASAHSASWLKALDEASLPRHALYLTVQPFTTTGGSSSVNHRAGSAGSPVISSEEELLVLDLGATLHHLVSPFMVARCCIWEYHRLAQRCYSMAVSSYQQRYQALMQVVGLPYAAGALKAHLANRAHPEWLAAYFERLLCARTVSGSATGADGGGSTTTISSNNSSVSVAQKAELAVFTAQYEREMVEQGKRYSASKSHARKNGEEERLSEGQTLSDDPSVPPSKPEPLSGSRLEYLTDFFSKLGGGIERVAKAEMQYSAACQTILLHFGSIVYCCYDMALAVADKMIGEERYHGSLSASTATEDGDLRGGESASSAQQVHMLLGGLRRRAELMVRRVQQELSSLKEFLQWLVFVANAEPMMIRVAQRRKRLHTRLWKQQKQRLAAAMVDDQQEDITGSLLPPPPPTPPPQRILSEPLPSHREPALFRWLQRVEKAAADSLPLLGMTEEANEDSSSGTATLGSAPPHRWGVSWDADSIRLRQDHEMLTPCVAKPATISSSFSGNPAGVPASTASSSSSGSCSLEDTLTRRLEEDNQRLVLAADRPSGLVERLPRSVGVGAGSLEDFAGRRAVLWDCLLAPSDIQAALAPPSDEEEGDEDDMDGENGEANADATAKSTAKETTIAGPLQQRRADLCNPSVLFRRLRCCYATPPSTLTPSTQKPVVMAEQRPHEEEEAHTTCEPPPPQLELLEGGQWGLSTSVGLLSQVALDGVATDPDVAPHWRQMALRGFASLPRDQYLLLWTSPSAAPPPPSSTAAAQENAAAPAQGTPASIHTLVTLALVDGQGKLRLTWSPPDEEEEDEGEEPAGEDGPGTRLGSTTTTTIRTSGGGGDGGAQDQPQEAGSPSLSSTLRRKKSSRLAGGDEEEDPFAATIVLSRTRRRQTASSSLDGQEDPETGNEEEVVEHDADHDDDDDDDDDEYLPAVLQMLADAAFMSPQPLLLSVSREKEFGVLSCGNKLLVVDLYD